MASRPRVASQVGLTVLEVIRELDSPAEVLQSEDPSQTMPRRLGLSDVVDQQIRRYREEVRRGRRITDEEAQDLFRLVIRRPDSEVVFFQVGKRLSGSDAPRARARFMPKSVAFALSRRATRRRLRALFGRRLGGFAPRGFTLEGRALLFIQADPGGDACLLLSGLCQGCLERRLGSEVQVAHSLCESRGDPLCRWSVVVTETALETGRGVGELVLEPEPEVS